MAQAAQLTGTQWHLATVHIKRPSKQERVGFGIAYGESESVALWRAATLSQLISAKSEYGFVETPVLSCEEGPPSAEIVAFGMKNHILFYTSYMFSVDDLCATVRTENANRSDAP